MLALVLMSMLLMLHEPGVVGGSRRESLVLRRRRADCCVAVEVGVGVADACSHLGYSTVREARGCQRFVSYVVAKQQTRVEDVANQSDRFDSQPKKKKKKKPREEECE